MRRMLCGAEIYFINKAISQKGGDAVVKINWDICD